MAGWNPVLCSSGGVAVRGLAPSGFTYRRELNRTAWLRARLALLDSDDADAYYEQLAGGLPQARLYRDGRLLFSGLWAPIQENAPSGDPGELAAEFRDPFDLLAHRYTPTGDTYTTEDAGEIAWALIDATAADAYLVLGTIEATKDRDRTYDRKQIAEAITELTEVEDGFDFTIAPLEFDVHGVLGRFDVHASKGIDRSAAVILEAGPSTRGTGDAITRQTDYPVTRAIVVGGGGLFGIANDLAAQAQYGVWEAIETRSDITEQATLDDKAMAMLRPEPGQSITVEPVPEVAPIPFTDYDVGDTVTIRGRVGAMVVDTTARVTAIEIDIDENGIETAHRIEAGDQRPQKLSDLFADIRRRLATTEATV